jgi:PHD/YefM family antitoxin component YafN of YafNO toxin-antitoxin module
MLEAFGDPGSLNTGGKKLAQKESNAAKAHGLQGPPVGTSSGAPGAPPPVPPVVFDPLFFRNQKLLEEKKNAAAAKLAQEEKNAAAAHGLQGLLPGTSSGAPGAIVLPAPPAEFDPFFVQPGCKRTRSGARLAPPDEFDPFFSRATRLRKSFVLANQAAKERVQEHLASHLLLHHLRSPTGLRQVLEAGEQASAGASIPNAKTETTDDQYAYTLSCLPRAETVVFDPRVQLETRLEELSDSIQKHLTVPADSEDLSESMRQAFDDSLAVLLPR